VVELLAQVPEETAAEDASTARFSVCVFVREAERAAVLDPEAVGHAYQATAGTTARNAAAASTREAQSSSSRPRTRTTASTSRKPT
jgi:hypothetical protein